MGLPVLVVTTHLCHCGAKAAINNIKKKKKKNVCVCACGPIRLMTKTNGQTTGCNLLTFAVSDGNMRFFF